MNQLLHVAMLAIGLKLAAAELPAEKAFTNSLGMKMVRIEPGEFLFGTRMGCVAFDEAWVKEGEPVPAE